MPITERVMGLGDWSIKLRDDTPFDVRTAIQTPFSTLVVTEARVPVTVLTDSIILTDALYAGVVLRPGPQFELGGCGLAWFLGDDKGGAGFLIDGLTISAGTLSSAVSTTLSGTAFTSGTIGSGSVAAWTTGSVTRRDVLSGLATQLGYEWRILPDRSVQVNSVANLYGASPTAVIVRRQGPQEVVTPFGVTGNVSSTWDWEEYGSKVYLWTNQARGVAGGASTYRDPAGNLMTITRGYELAEAPAGTENAIADWWLGQINRAVRTVEVDSTTYAVTGYAPCGGSVYLYDPEQGLYDTAVQVQYGGGIINPVSARVVSVTWPVERGMGVYVRKHDGTNVSYVDLSDWVEWESGTSRFEISTGAQVLSPPSSTPLADLWRPWQTYTPTWDAYTTPPAIGNGTITGAYRRLGTALEVRVTLTIGSTTNLGAGGWVFYLPSGCVGKTQAGLVQIGKAVLAYPSSANGERQAEVKLDSGGSFMILVYGDPWANVTGGAPFAFGAGDTVNVTATFEVAP